MSGGRGSSPVLAIPCPKCGAAVDEYCRKGDGSAQVIAHKVRRDAWWKEHPPEVSGKLQFKGVEIEFEGSKEDARDVLAIVGGAIGKVLGRK